MKKRPLSTLEIIGIVFLLILAIGASWYLFFYKPLQTEITQINNECSEMDSQIQVASAKLAKMNSMQKEIDEIFAASDDPSEIAAYDNSQAVMNQLNSILSTTKEYSLGFSNPTIDGNGIARRTVTMNFAVNSYEEAKGILLALEKNHWRCVVSNVSFSASDAAETGIIANVPVAVSASIVFFESTNVKAEESAPAA